MKTQAHKPRIRAARACLALMLACCAAAPAAAASSFEAHYTTASLSAQEQTAGNLLNSDRARYNLAPLLPPVPHRNGFEPELPSLGQLFEGNWAFERYLTFCIPGGMAESRIE